MKTADSSIDPGHESSRVALSRTGLALVGLGVPCAVVGAGLFVSTFFAADLHAAFPRAVVGLILASVGGFLSVSGMPLLFAANAGKVLRYQAGEVLPVQQDAMRVMGPAAFEMTRGVARSAAEGWTEGSAGPGLAHACGTWNDADARFCKGCGAPLTSRSCPICRATIDADAQFCPKCGSKVER